jgi:predicted MPP superfamily phosphohydrolase
MNRRAFIKKSFWGFTGLSVFSSLYAWQVEPFWLEFVRLKMPIKNLPASLAGKTLMQISDIHIGNRFNYQYIIDSFKKAHEFQPDFVAYTGDYVSTYKGEVQYDKLQEVLNHSVKGRSGTVAILGNHDYGRNWLEKDVAEKITGMFTGSEISMLRNDQLELNGLNFIGLDDYWGPEFNPQLVMNNYDDTKANVLLCHNPDVCDMDVWNNYSGWILSGHTHGGQCKPPFLPPPMLPVKNNNYTAGKFELTGGRTLYINKALGHLWQVRFNVRPEITIFELESA